jgi:hypothetical protein
MLKKILRTLLIIVAGFLGIGLLLPGNTHFDRSIDIAAPATAVFDQINELKNWDKWTPFKEFDPDMKITFSEPTSGVSSTYAWIGNAEIGEGKMTIVESKPAEKVRFRIENKGSDPFFADLTLTAKDSTATKVVWAFDKDNGMSPLARWFGFGVESFLGSVYEKGLANLKGVCEKK